MTMNPVVFFLTTVVCLGIALGAAPLHAQEGGAYKPPARGAPASRVGGGSRGLGGVLPSVRVLAPDHTGLTTQEQPVLYWFIDRPADTRVEITVIDDKSVEPLLERFVEAPREAGVQRLDLAALGVRLAPNVEYRWHVGVVPDPSRRSGDIVASGTIKRVAASAALASRLAQTEDAARYRVYAEEGLWYDALAALSRRIEARPDDGAVRRLRAALLREVGLDDAATYENRR